MADNDIPFPLILGVTMQQSLLLTLEPLLGLFYYYVTAGPTSPPLDLSCVGELLGSEVIISCTSDRKISTLQFTCSFDGVAFSQGCKFPGVHRSTQVALESDV